MDKNLHIPQGYRQTEVGVIPDDWEVVRLGNIVTFLDNQRKPLKEVDRQKIQGTYPYYGASGIIDYINDYIFDEELILIGEDGANIIDRSSRLVFLASGKYWVNNHAHILKIKDFMVNYYLCEYLETLTYEKYNTGTAQPKLNKEIVSKITVLKPPKLEQQKITNILTTWDNAINQQTTLIEKKQQLKKGLMQQLLTAKTRFSEFSDDWKMMKLLEISKITMGQSPSSSSYNDEKIGVPLIQGNADCKNRKTLPRHYTTKKTKECFVDDIIMTVRAPVGVISKSIHNACIGRGVCAIKSNYKNNFLYYFLVNYETKWEAYSQGSTFTAVNSSDIKNLKCLFPPLVKEQQKIAQVLTLADNEITKLQTELALLKTQKKGLMQQLLTGKTRVKL